MKITKQQAIILAVVLIAIAVVLYFLLRKDNKSKKTRKRNSTDVDYYGYNDSISLPTEGTGVVTYVVKEGDTLSGIAAAYNTTVDYLANKNNISNPDLIVVGQKIYI